MSHLDFFVNYNVSR